ncbi:MAG: CoA transferase [Caldilineales bacterium]|nr:CoA transferase [Caldilineales bacterium]MDW8318959.1 CaiB/BaiF CoA-transferase family protein [Anaerolineae bacterium]
MSDFHVLRGLRVLEFTHAVLGPACGLVLADLGAEVIRVEPPDGDPTRRLRGFGTGYYPFFNRNKKSLALDLKAEAGREVVARLLETTDVLVENFAPGTMDRLGLGYADLAERYPRLIYCSLKGFFPGPYEHRLALDEVVQMMSGLAYMTGPVGQPLRAGASVVDIMTGVCGAVAVLAALRERDRTGRGQLVRSALFETAAFIMGHHMAYAALTQEPVPPMPARVSAWAIYRTFATADGELVFIGVTSDKQWARFCQVFERPDWLADPRLATNNGRIEQREWLLPAVEALIARYPREEVLRLCELAELPVSPVARPEDLFDDPQLQAGGSLLLTPLPDGRCAPLPRLPILLDGCGAELESPPPALGQHSRAILADLGLDEAAIEALIRQGVVAG